MTISAGHNHKIGGVDGHKIGGVGDHKKGGVGDHKIGGVGEHKVGGVGEHFSICRFPISPFPVASVRPQRPEHVTRKPQ